MNEFAAISAKEVCWTMSILTTILVDEKRDMGNSLNGKTLDPIATRLKRQTIWLYGIILSDLLQIMIFLQNEIF